MIGRRSQVRRAILDKNVRVPEERHIGYDLDEDRRVYHVTESGIVVVEGHRSPVDIATMLVIAPLPLPLSSRLGPFLSS